MCRRWGGGRCAEEEVEGEVVVVEAEPQISRENSSAAVGGVEEGEEGRDVVSGLDELAVSEENFGLEEGSVVEGGGSVESLSSARLKEMLPKGRDLDAEDRKVYLQRAQSVSTDRRILSRMMSSFYVSNCLRDKKIMDSNTA